MQKKRDYDDAIASGDYKTAGAILGQIASLAFDVKLWARVSRPFKTLIS